MNETFANHVDPDEIRMCAEVCYGKAFSAPKIIGPDKDFFQFKIVTIFLTLNLNMHLGCSKELSQ